MKKIIITNKQYGSMIYSGLIKENKSVKFVHESLDLNRIKAETVELLKSLYKNNPNISNFWIENGLSYEEICKSLMTKGLLLDSKGGYVVPKSMDPSSAVKAIEYELLNLVNDKQPKEKEIEEEVESEESIVKRNPEANKQQLIILGNNDDVAIFKDREGSLYAFYIGDVENPEIKDSDSETVSKFVNNNLGKITKGIGISDWDSGKDLVKIDDELKRELYDIYDKDKNIAKFLKTGLEEGNSEWPETYRDLQPKKRTNAENSAILDKLAYLKDREERRNPPTKSKTPLPETTVAASSGSFSAPIATSDKKQISLEIPVVAEDTTVASVGGQYDTPGLPGIGRNGEFKKTKKTSAQIKTQYPNGDFVNTSECTKLNNNKGAQNGGCSQGAVDGVVKLSKGKGSVISPSLSENEIIEEVARKTGRSVEGIKEILRRQNLTK